MELRDLVLQTLNEVSQEDEQAESSAHSTQELHDKHVLSNEELEDVIDLESLENNALDSSAQASKTLNTKRNATHTLINTRTTSQHNAKPTKRKKPLESSLAKPTKSAFNLSKISIASSPITEGKLISLDADELASLHNAPAQSLTPLSIKPTPTTSSIKHATSKASKHISSTPTSISPKQPTLSSKLPPQSPPSSSTQLAHTYNDASHNDEYLAFLEHLRERLLVLFEGLKTPNLHDSEQKLDLVLRFLQYQLCTIDDTLQKERAKHTSTSHT